MGSRGRGPCAHPSSGSYSCCDQGRLLINLSLHFFICKTGSPTPDAQDCEDVRVPSPVSKQSSSNPLRGAGFCLPGGPCSALRLAVLGFAQSVLPTPKPHGMDAPDLRPSPRGQGKPRLGQSKCCLILATMIGSEMST